MYIRGHITKENQCGWGGERELEEMLGEGRVSQHTGGMGALRAKHKALLSSDWKGSHCLMDRGMSKPDVFTG